MVVITLQLVAATSAGGRHHRRSMPTQQTLPVSKSGWRPVVGSGGLAYSGSYNTAPLQHAPSYKVPVIDYPSSVRPLATRDSAKLTSIAQSYRPTTLRTVSAAAPAPPANQPINSYHNPFAFNNNLSYKFIQSFPVENIVIRNPQNPYAARPVYTKYQNKVKQTASNMALQQLTNVQPVQFGQYQTGKPIVFGKPIESYVRPTDNKQTYSGIETYKPEVYKLPDSDTAPQSVSQTVKTAQQQAQQIHRQQQLQQQHHHQQQAHHPQQQQYHQQQHLHHQQTQPQQFLIETPKTPYFTYQDPAFPPSILGTFGSFGLQSVKGRDPVFPHTKTTYLPPQPSKQTVFNSFSFTPTFKTTPAIYNPTTTPKFQTTANQLQFNSALNDYNGIKNIPIQPTKASPPPKIDPNANKGSFKASPQDPFSKHELKHYQKDYNLPVTTYNPVQTTTLASNYLDYNYQTQHSPQFSNYYDQPVQSFNYQKKKQKIHDSITANNNQATQHYVSSPISIPTYEVTENTESEDVYTQASPAAWTHSYDTNIKTTEEPVTKQLSPDFGFSKHTTTTYVPDLPEEYAIVTEAEKGYENSLNYDGQVETQSRRPLGDDFEPIGKHKLKDYYYKVSTAAYDDYNSSKRTKKPSESSKLTAQPEVTTTSVNKENTNETPADALPTLPPNKHFKRPSTLEPLDKDRIRKRNKNRRRRPPLANINREESSTSTRKYVHSSTEQSPSTEAEEVHTIRPRIRPTHSKPQPNLTTPSVTTDLTTSAVPTISPTAPTIIKKKLIRRPLTTVTDRVETTTISLNEYDNNKESPIMKIATRHQHPKYNSNYETPDYTHKQDEKDTPTSDVAVSASDNLKITQEAAKTFAFHKDVKPIEAKLETTTEKSRANNDNSEITSTSRTETSSSSTSKIQRPRLKNKFNRPRFSVKDYRNRLSSTTSTTERSTESTTKLRFPQRKVPNNDDDAETTTERKKFTPKDPRHKQILSDINEDNENDNHNNRYRQRQTTVENIENTTQKISARIRNGLRRPKPTEETAETTTVHNKRPLRKKIKDSDIGESVQDISVTETTVHYDHKNDITSERTRSESAIMKIADKKHHQDPIEHLFEHSKRVSDLTLAASKDYNTPGMFKTVSSNSRRIPNYFTIATDDPILPIEAFFPQLNQKKET
ncbi:unnamed protein product [Diatraea saccharalis]|uniref:Uncharacterized protein n=1 Tax=Diatraea saccharalis TaxID=40085 RepID=A0A9N9RF40_9NEOP|nr:unnamed protein product [Diatraea saccharalis]